MEPEKEVKVSKEYIRELLRGRPNIYYSFDEYHYTVEKMATIVAQLDPDAKRVLSHVVNHLYLESGYDGIDQTKELINYMFPPPECDPMSYTWDLFIYSGNSGSFYDCCGWPGDNQYGFGIFIPYANGPFQMIFENGDMWLGVFDGYEYLEDIIEKYEKRRRKKLFY